MSESAEKTVSSDRPVRLIDVARYAQVSRATAARALANNARVGKETRQKVLKAAEILSYEPNLLARGLRSGRTMSVGIVGAIASLSPMGEILRRIAYSVQGFGYTTTVGINHSDPKCTRQLLTELVRRRADGVVLSAAGLPDIWGERQLLNQFRAVVVIGSFPLLSDLEFDCVSQNPEPAIRDVVNHFASIGRRRLAILIPSTGSEFKQQVFVDQAARLGCRVRTIHVPWRADGISGRDYQRTLADAVGDRIDFDAVFCVPDEGAARAMTYLRSVGRRIPEDVAVVGFNDSTFAEDLCPPLASIARHDDRLAQLVVERLLARLDDESNDSPQRHEINMEFVHRASAGGSG